MKNKNIMIELNTTELTEKIDNTKGLLAVDVWATWCNPCRILGPIYQQISEEMNDKLTFTKYQLEDENLEYFKSNHANLDVRGIPTILFFRDGKLVDKNVGIKNKEQLVEKITSLL